MRKDTEGHIFAMGLLADTEGGEDVVEDIVRCRRAGDAVERTEGCVEIEQQHLVGYVGGCGDAGLLQRFLTFPEQPFLPQARDESRFPRNSLLRCHGSDDRPPEIANAVTCSCGDEYSSFSPSA